MIRELLTSPIAYHLWQSTVFAGLAALLALVLRNNAARLRYGVWFAASMKFLVPLAPLVALGSIVKWRPAPIVTDTVPARLDSVFAPAFAPIAAAQPHAPGVIPLMAIITAIWACGFAIAVARWFVHWMQIRNIARRAKPIGVEAGIPVRLCGARIEPGIFGVFRPVLLLPEGIIERLSGSELRAVITHEMCHVRRRDNLLASLHMLVEALFWFHPLVWWIGSRLVEERERACDEDVVRSGSEPRVYAESILRTCELYLESPVACISGVTGGELKVRIGRIVSSYAPRRLGYAKGALLASSAMVATAVPLMLGLIHAQRLNAQSEDSTKHETFDIVSIKPADPGDRENMIQFAPGGRLVARSLTVKLLLQTAYQVQDFHIVGAPDWTGSQRFTIEAKSSDSSDSDPRKMTNAEIQARAQRFETKMRGLLQDRFGLKAHRETREMPVYALVIARNGPKLSSGEPQNADGSPRRPASYGGPGRLSGENATLEMLAQALSRRVGRTVLNQTGLNGSYDYKLAWTSGPGEILGASDTAQQSDTSGPSLFTAIQEQLGLKLEPTKAPVEVVVIDHISRPAPN